MNMVIYALSGGGLLTEAMKTSFSTALTNIGTDVTGMITTALPIGLGIMGLGLAIRIGIRFFKSVAN